MNKIEKIERRSRTIIVKRNNSAYKQAKLKTSVLHVDSEAMQDKLATCKTQAQMIDVALANSMSITDTAIALVTFNLCKNDVDARKRIKRHEKHDVVSRIVKRAVSMREHINSQRV